MRQRKFFVIALALALLGIVAPNASAADDSKSCKDLMASDTPAYVVCRWLATPEEAAEIAKFWLGNDGENMKNTLPFDSPKVNCTEAGNVCSDDLEGDGIPHDAGDPDVPGAEDDEGKPECKDGETTCSVDPDTVSQEELKAAAESPAGQSAKTATDSGLRVWIDTDLTDDWKAGKLAEAVKQVAALTAQPGVIGVRFSSQVGYNQTLTSAEEVEKFVTEASAALRKAVPGKKLAIHTVIPLFGCGANDACKTEIAKKYPTLDPELFTRLLAAGTVDQLGLDDGHLATEFTTWKIDAAEAQRNQWIQVRARAWDAYAQIAAEDAVFTAPDSSKLTAEQAEKTITERVAAVLQADAAETVTLWTRWQDPNGTVNRVLGAKLADNPTWEKLKLLGSVKPRLATIYDPAAPEVDVATDMKKLAEVFGQLYVRG